MDKFGNVRAILFDIDNTLFPSTKFSSLARKNAVCAMIASGMRASLQNALEQLQKITLKYGSNYPRHFNLLVQKFECKNKAYSIAAGIWAYHCTKASISPFKGTLDLLGRLRKKGYILCAASRGIETKQWDKLIRLGLDMSFDNVFITKTKNKNFYKKIASKLKLNPSEILMVGDNPKDDILSAKEAGLKTIFISSSKWGSKSPGADAKLTSLSILSRLL